eukprot:SAG11_NODE_81_length_17673_cov_7.702572_17_plen_360_part_00
MSQCGDRQLAKIVAAPVVDVSSSGALQVLHEENVSTVPLAKKRTVGPTTNVRLVLSRAEMSVDQALAHDDGDSVFMLILRGKANGNEALSTARQHVDGMRRIATPWHRDGVHATPRVWRALAEVDKLGALAARLQLLAFARMALGEAGPTTAAKGMELPADMLRYTAERWLSAVADVAVLRRMRVIVPYLRGQRPDEHLVRPRDHATCSRRCGTRGSKRRRLMPSRLLCRVGGSTNSHQTGNAGAHWLPRRATLALSAAAPTVFRHDASGTARASAALSRCSRCAPHRSSWVAFVSIPTSDTAAGGGGGGGRDGCQDGAAHGDWLWGGSLADCARENGGAAGGGHRAADCGVDWLPQTL